MATQEKILKNRTIGTLPPTTNATARYVMDEGTGTLVEDSIGINDGTLTSGAWLGSGNFGYTGNNAVTITAGSTSYVTIPDDAAFDDLTTGTVEMWIRPAYTGTPASFIGLFSKGGTGGSVATWGAYHFTDGNIYFHLNGGGGLNMGQFQPVANTWYHLVFTWDGANVRRYVNGVLVSTVASVAASGNSALPFYIGSYVYNTTTRFSWSGGIDCFSVYKNSVMTAETVLSNYRNGYQKQNNLIIDSMYQCIETIEIPAPLTYADFTYPLNGDSDGGYKITLDIENPTASDSLYSLRINGVNQVVARSYYEQTGAASLANAYETANAGAELQLDPTGDDGTAIIKIPFSKSGTGNWERFAFYETTKGTADANLSARRNALHMITTPANSVKIESLGIVGSIASSIGAGSVLKLWKLKNHA